MALPMTDAIPLMQPDGIEGRNNAKDFRTQMLAALLLPDAIGPGVRPGILPRGWIGLTTNQYVDLKVLALGSPDSAVQMYPGRCVVHRTGQGPYILTQETTVTGYDLDDADVTNPRIDVIYARIYDHAIGDSSGGPHGPYIEHVNGSPSGSPAVPAIPTDAIPIASILRPANTNAVTSGNITDLRKSTSLNGTPRPLLPGDSLADPGLFVSERRLRMASATQITAGTSPFIEDIWCADSTWKPVADGIPTVTSQPRNLGTYATTTYGFTRVGAGATTPVGVPFVAPPSGRVRIDWSAAVRNSGASGITLCAIRVGTGSSLAAGTAILDPVPTNDGDLWAIQATGTDDTQASMYYPLSGLTAGNVYNAVLAYRINTGTGTISRVAITATPVP